MHFYLTLIGALLVSSRTFQVANADDTFTAIDPSGSSTSLDTPTVSDSTSSISKHEEIQKVEVNIVLGRSRL
jgi:hypothetical protein